MISYFFYYKGLCLEKCLIVIKLLYYLLFAATLLLSIHFSFCIKTLILLNNSLWNWSLSFIFILAYFVILLSWHSWWTFTLVFRHWKIFSYENLFLTTHRRICKLSFNPSIFFNSIIIILKFISWFTTYLVTFPENVFL